MDYASLHDRYANTYIEQILSHLVIALVFIHQHIILDLPFPAKCSLFNKEYLIINIYDDERVFVS
jgi:hypothetical protein